MEALQLIFFILGLVLLILAGVGVDGRRAVLGWLGLASWLFAAELVPLIFS